MNDLTHPIVELVGSEGADELVVGGDLHDTLQVGFQDAHRGEERIPKLNHAREIMRNTIPLRREEKGRTSSEWASKTLATVEGRQKPWKDPPSPIIGKRC